MNGAPSRTIKLMRYLTFPTAQHAQAFTEELTAAQLGQVSAEHHTLNTPGVMNGTVTGTTSRGEEIITAADGRQYVDAGGGTADDAGMGAIKGTGAGAAVGIAAGAVATIATGGLALPLILGLGALGSAVGASVGAVGGALGVDETPGTSLLGTREVVDLNDDDQQVIYISGSEGRAVAVDEDIPLNELQAIMQRHGGTLVGAPASS